MVCCDGLVALALRCVHIYRCYLLIYTYMCVVDGNEGRFQLGLISNLFIDSRTYVDVDRI